MKTNRIQTVVVVGGGFAGINAAKRLARRKSLQIIVLDRRNHHLFQPLLYQVATAGLSPGEIATPIRTVLARYPNVRVLFGEALGVDHHRRVLRADFGELSFDFLVLACGSQHSYFGRENWETFAPGLKTLEQATEIRRRVLTAFEMAERTDDDEISRRHLTFVVVGGGPTGVELAGALAEISHFALKKDFRHIDPVATRIVLVEAGERILAAFEPELSARAESDLTKLGVTVRKGVRVTNIDADGVTIGDEKIPAATVLWAAGVSPSSLNVTLGVPVDRAGRVIVEKDLSLPGHPNVFVLGDQACFMQDGAPLPGLAPVAIQQGRAVARTIFDTLDARPRREFRYFDKGQMATIGRRRAVLQSGGIKLGGTLAWWGWLVIHIYYLIGFRNRVIVILEWVWAYLTYKPGAQLITQREWRSFPGLNASSDEKPKSN